jgi:O-methyltransferase domain/Dimerisation domain
MAEAPPDAGLRVELAGRIMGFMVSQAVYVVAKLGIADLLAEGPRAAAELADATKTDRDSLYRLLRMLAGYGIFIEHEDWRFANSELSDLLRDYPGSSRDFALVFGEEFYPAFGETLRLVETGDPSFDTVFGAAWDDYLDANPEKSTRFNRFMAGGKEALADVLASDGWRGDETVVDVGGGNGALLQALLERRQGLRGVVFDLPHVASEAEERIRAAGLRDRCQVVAGSYFDGVPGGDVYVLSHILHGYEDERAGDVLRAVRDAIPDDGRLLIIDGVMAGPNEPGMKLMDLLMLSVGGRERTEEEWRALLSAGGFELSEIRPTPLGSILEAVPT